MSTDEEDRRAKRELRERVTNLRQLLEKNDNILKDYARPEIESSYGTLKDTVNDTVEYLERYILYLEPHCRDAGTIRLLEADKRKLAETRRSVQRDLAALLSIEPTEFTMENFATFVVGVLRRIQFLIPMISQLQDLRDRLDNIYDPICPSEGPASEDNPDEE